MAPRIKVPIVSAGRGAVGRGAVVARRDPPTEEHSLKLMTIQEAARYARVSVQTVRRWIKEGKLKTYRAGRLIRIDLNDLVQFLSQ